MRFLIQTAISAVLPSERRASFWLAASILPPVAVRQKSDSKSGKLKKPRVQCILTEPQLAKLEAFAEEEGLSVSAAAAHCIREFFAGREAVASTGSEPLGPFSTDDGKMAKLVELLKAGKAAGII